MSVDAHPDIRDRKLPFGSGWMPGDNTQPGPRQIDIQCLQAPQMGTWQVTVKHQGAAAVFGQRRNLIRLQPDTNETTFYTCLTPYIPSMTSAKLTSLDVFASVAGGTITDMQLQPASVRRVFIAGDSTVADQSAPAPWYPYDSYCGWGQMLSLFLPNDAVCNQAHSGLTARCFQDDGHFDIVLNALQPGDLVLMQFGHNDQKRRNLQPNGGYQRFLMQMIDIIRVRKAQPVLLTPVSRVPAQDAAGTFDLLAGHAAAVRQLAEEQGLPCIDLHTYTFQKYIRMGDSCRDMFKPGDATHANDYGAYEIACYVAQQLQAAGLAKPIFPDVHFGKETDSALNPETRPGSPLPVSYVDLTDDLDSAILQRGVQTGLLDPCVLRMHPHEPLPRGQFMQMLFRRAGLKTSPTNGIAPFTDVGAREWDSPYATACKALGLVTGDCYRPDDMVTGSEAIDLCRKAGLDASFPNTDTPLTKYQIICGLLGK